MRTIRLQRTFDAVFVQDAITYMTTQTDLQAAMRTAFEHCRVVFGALFVPDYVREIFVPQTPADSDLPRAAPQSRGDPSPAVTRR